MDAPKGYPLRWHGRDDLRRRARAHAGRLDMSINDLVLTLIDEHTPLLENEPAQAAN